MLAFDFDAVVIGAGAVGLACAAELSKALGSTLVLEGTASVGSGISSRNSEVVHAGLYYQTGTLKQSLSIRGRKLLYDYFDRYGVSYQKCGKLIVATNAKELNSIEKLAELALANGVESTRLLERSEVRAMEPDVTAVGALLSLETGIFDSHAYMMSLSGEIEAHGGHIALRSPLYRAAPVSEGFRVWSGGAEPTEVTCRFLINSAGLSAPGVAGTIERHPSNAIPRLKFAKGNYFGLSGAAPFQHLIYPAPVDGGLGIHATLDLSGRVRFGPDVEWLLADTTVADLDFDVSKDRMGAFYAAIRRYWPGLPDGALYPDYSGVRPKLSGPGESQADFCIQTESEHGLPGLVNLFGIESPGLTASLAIAERVCDVLLERR